jgi:hypothetical protein
MAAAAAHRDPRAWGFRYELAVLQARAGHDPAAAAREAIALNPRGQAVVGLNALLRAHGPDELRRVGARLSFMAG